MTRRFFQFSLATMLFFVAAICVVLAVRTNRQHNRRVAIAKIESLGGGIRYFSEWDRLSTKGIVIYTDKLRVPTMHGQFVAKITVPEVRLMARLSEWDRLSTKGIVIYTDKLRVPTMHGQFVAKITVPEVRLMARLLGGTPCVIEVLFPHACKITDADLKTLLPLVELQSLVIGDNSVSDVGLMRLLPLSELKSIDLYGDTNVTDDGIARFQEALPNCVVEN